MNYLLGEIGFNTSENWMQLYKHVTVRVATEQDEGRLENVFRLAVWRQFIDTIGADPR